MSMGNNDEGCSEDNGIPVDKSSRPSQNNGDRPPVVVSANNFENYWRMKMRGSNRSEERRNDDVNDAPNATTNTHEEERWNHFTAPLTQEPPTRKRYESPSSSSSPTPTSDLLSTPSVFSDLERSQTVDRFSTIFMERMGEAMSSGKLSKAWQSGSSGVGGIGSSLFSWMFTDHSADYANTNANMDEGYSTPKTINPADYAAEKRMIEPHFTPFVWGSSCMVVTLFSLRLGRWYQGGGQAVGRTLTSSVNRTASNHAQMTAATSNNNAKSLKDVRHAQHYQSHSTSSGGNSSPFNSTRKKELTNELMASLNTVPVDMALSMLIGISTTIFLTSPSNLMKDLSDAPLVEGKSALAEELCLPFREEMRNVNGLYHTYTLYNANNVGNGNRNDTMPDQRQVVPYSNLWEEENLGDFDSLRSIRDFVSNCHEREEVARRMIAPDSDTALSEQELLELKIPPSGISPSI